MRGPRPSPMMIGDARCLPPRPGRGIHTDRAGIKGDLTILASERGPSAPVPSIMYENWTGVDMMYQLDDRRRRQSLV